MDWAFSEVRPAVELKASVEVLAELATGAGASAIAAGGMDHILRSYALVEVNKIKPCLAGPRAQMRLVSAEQR
jgi:hypothetical protein